MYTNIFEIGLIVEAKTKDMNSFTTTFAHNTTKLFRSAFYLYYVYVRCKTNENL